MHDSVPANRFDSAYYQKYYLDPITRVTDSANLALRAGYVAHFLKYMGQPVRGILDAGCGIGLWREPLAHHFPEAPYQGIEISAYLCETHGWTQASVVDYRPKAKRFDLVICQGVLQYLGDEDAERAIANLARLCRGSLFLEALTRRDWDENCEQAFTDGNVHLRDGAWYRTRLTTAGFRNCGGGLFLAKESPAVLFELETL